MKRLRAADFPELRRVFSGYLHEDLVAEYGTPSAALRAFHEDADESERRQFAKEARQFLERTTALDFKDVRAVIARLGCRWTPPSRKALEALLADPWTS